MKKILAIVLAAVMLLSMTACGAAAKKDTYVVGICQLVQHDALDAATKGFQDALTEALGDKVKFEVQNASGDSVNCTTIINGFVSSKVDLIMANATPALQAAASATSDCMLWTSIESLPARSTSLSISWAAASRLPSTRSTSTCTASRSARRPLARRRVSTQPANSCGLTAQAMATMPILPMASAHLPW